MKPKTVKEINDDFIYHTQRAFYWLEKKRRLAPHAHSRRTNCRKMYVYHMEQRDKIRSQVTGADVQMYLLP